MLLKIRKVFLLFAYHLYLHTNLISLWTHLRNLGPSPLQPAPHLKIFLATFLCPHILNMDGINEWISGKSSGLVKWSPAVILTGLNWKENAFNIPYLVFLDKYAEYIGWCKKQQQDISLVEASSRKISEICYLCFCLKQFFFTCLLFYT